jgi:hypothetical protein
MIHLTLIGSQRSHRDRVDGEAQPLRVCPPQEHPSDLSISGPAGPPQFGLLLTDHAGASWYFSGVGLMN